LIDINLWDRQPGEGEKAWEAFRVYRDMEGRRSARGASEILRGDDATYGGMGNWSVKWHWLARVNAYDRHMDRMETEGRAMAVKLMAARHAMIANEFIGKALKQLQTIDPRTLNNDQLIKWFKEAVKIERLSRGESTENINTNHSGYIEKNDFDLSKLNDDDFETVHRAMVKIHSNAAISSGEGEKDKGEPD